MKLTLNIPSQRLNFVLELLNSLDFIEIESSEVTDTDNDWWFDLTPAQQNRIKASLIKLDNGEGIPHEEVKNKVKQLLNKHNK